MLVMFDAVTLANIPANATHIAAYVDGRFANVTEAHTRFPHAKILTITTGTGDADCIDCETGDATPAQAIAWVQARLAAGHYRPCVYANASTWGGELGPALAKYGPRIRRWIAAFPGTGANIPAGFDAHQYSTGAIDTSVCLADFFDAAPTPPKPKPKPVVREASAEIQVSVPEGSRGKLHFRGTFDIQSGAWTAHGVPALGVHWSDSDGGKWRIKGLPFNDPPLGK